MVQIVHMRSLHKHYAQYHVGLEHASAAKTATRNHSVWKIHYLLYLIEKIFYHGLNLGDECTILHYFCNGQSFLVLANITTYIL